MKKLHIRFFNDKNDGVPVNSYPISLESLDDMNEVCTAIESWMTEHPEGKVDQVML